MCDTDDSSCMSVNRKKKVVMETRNFEKKEKTQSALQGFDALVRWNIFSKKIKEKNEATIPDSKQT